LEVENMARVKSLFEKYDPYGEESEQRTTFFPVVLPPKEYVIQGIAKPESRMKATLTERVATKVERTTDRTQILSNHEGRQNEKRWSSLNRNENNVQRREKTSQNGLCAYCDFLDKKYSFCLIKRLNGRDAPCPYKNGVNGIALVERSKPQYHAFKPIFP